MSRPSVVSREELEAFVRERVAAALDDPRHIARSALDLLVDRGARESRERDRRRASTGGACSG